MSEEKNIHRPDSSAYGEQPPTAAPAGPTVSAPAPQPKKKRKGIKTLIAGVVCLVLAGVSLAAVLVGGSSLASSVTGNKGQVVAVPGQLRVNAGELYIVSLPVDQVNSGATCTASGNGVEVANVSHQGELEANRKGAFKPEGMDQEYSPVLTVTAVSPSAEGVRLDCGNTEQAFVSDPVNAAVGGGVIIAGVAGMFVFGLAGFILVVIGLVRLVRSNKRS